MNDDRPISMVRRHKPSWDVRWTSTENRPFHIPDAAAPPEFVPGFVIFTQPSLVKMAIPAEGITQIDWEMTPQS